MWLCINRIVSEDICMVVCFLDVCWRLYTLSTRVRQRDETFEEGGKKIKKQEVRRRRKKRRGRKRWSN